MRTVINKVFRDFKFKQIELPLINQKEAIFFANLNNDSLNFYLVLFTDEMDILSQEQQFEKYYREIKGIEHGYDERMDKNLSMLVCLTTDSISRKENVIKKVFEIEENPYFFKKYVLSYTSSQSLYLTEYFAEYDALHTSTLINNIVNDSKTFVSFKKEPDNVENSLYSMCSKLLIKLPFVSFERGEKKIENLSENLNVELSNNDLLENVEGLLDLLQSNNKYDIDEILNVLSEDDENEF